MKNAESRYYAQLGNLHKRAGRIIDAHGVEIPSDPVLTGVKVDHVELPTAYSLEDHLPIAVVRLGRMTQSYPTYSQEHIYIQTYVRGKNRVGKPIIKRPFNARVITSEFRSDSNITGSIEFPNGQGMMLAFNYQDTAEEIVDFAERYMEDKEKAESIPSTH